MITIVTSAKQLRRYLSDIKYEIPAEFRHKITEAQAKEYYQDVMNERHKIWDKKYWGIKIHESICAAACPVDNDLKAIDKMIHLLK